jgi:hypothetical protein
MKKTNIFRLVGIIAFVAIIGFVMAACEVDSRDYHVMIKNISGESITVVQIFPSNGNGNWIGSQLIENNGTYDFSWTDNSASSPGDEVNLDRIILSNQTILYWSHYTEQPPYASIKKPNKPTAYIGKTQNGQFWLDGSNEF